MLKNYRANASRGVPVSTLAFAGSTKLYCAATGAYGCKQPAQSCELHSHIQARAWTYDLLIVKSDALPLPHHATQFQSSTEATKKAKI